MSRKRKEKRAKERELARQLGDAEDAPDDLIERLRVTRVELRPGAVTVEKSGAGLLSAIGGRPRTEFELGVLLLEAHRARWVTRQTVQGGPEKAGTTSPLEVATDHDLPDLPADGRVRYARPAHFVLAAWVRPNADTAPSFEVPEVQVGGGWHSLTDGALARLDADTVHAGRLRLDGEECEASFWVQPAVHRIKGEPMLLLDDGRRRWRVEVKLSA